MKEKKPKPGAYVEVSPVQTYRDDRIAHVMAALVVMAFLIIIAIVYMKSVASETQATNAKLHALGEALGYNYYAERTVTEPARWEKPQPVKINIVELPSGQGFDKR